MTRAEEYRLSQYQHLGALREDKSIDLVRNQQTGLIGVKKVISSELYPVYLFLKEHTNPYLPVIYECIQLDENRLLIIEEYETGKNLEECLESGMKFSETEAAGMIRDLCLALQPLHDAKPPIICRDLKAENVMLTADHRIKLIDFDIARQYQPGKHRDTVMMGTEGYAAPEQFGFSQTDARTDIYGLGVLFNYLLTGKFPVEEKAAGQMGKIISRCTAMNPEDRYQDVKELMCALENAGAEKSPKQQKSSVIVSDHATKEHSISWAPPGFRSGNFWKMLLAGLGYLFVAWICFSMDFHNTDGTMVNTAIQYVNRICLWSSQMASIFLIGDYRGVRRKIPLLNHPARSVRIIGDVLLYMVLFVAAVMIAMILEGLF